MELTIIKQNGSAYIDSREVADAIGKRHHDLLRDIGKYLKYMEKVTESKIAFSDFFIESTYLDSTGRTLPCYLISKRGAEVIANKLTGEKGVLFTFAYVAKFNALEYAERAEFAERSVTPQLKAFNAAVRNVLSGYANTNGTFEEIMDFLKGAYKPFGIEVASYEGKYRWTATDIAEYLGVYSESGLPHSHAVASIIEKVKLNPQHIAVVPYGMVGITMHYDGYVPGEVYNWLADNNFPRDIPHLGFEYHVCYDN
jgi:Rha family phage regulatory protein